MKYKIKKVEYYGFNHEKVCKHFEGNLTFVNEFCIRGEYKPVAVYKAKKPNRKKGHKKYVLLQTQLINSADLKSKKQTIVRGMSAKDMEKERYQHAIHCTACNLVLYSINRHHYHTCGCENDTVVDGGKDYLRSGGLDLTKTRIVKLDLLTNTVKEYKK